ncbi:uncharacterized protein [Drosophila tropicalis]|uniref:uncharacterized protein n=1 Tax=Drosophila tropicalis TaxID=46794 RepID=UPI0035ABD2D1
MAARKRMTTHPNNGRKRDRDRDKERFAQTPPIVSGPYWRNMSPELDRGAATSIPSVAKGKPLNGTQSASVNLSNRLPKSGGSRVRIEGRVTPSSRNSLEMARKMSGVPQLFVEVAAASAPAQSPRKASITDSSKTKAVASTRSLGTKKASLEPSPSTSPTATRTGMKSANPAQSKLEDYEKIPTPPSLKSASPSKTVSPLKDVTPKASAKQLLTSPIQEPPEDDNIQPDNDDQTEEKDLKNVEDVDGQKMAMCVPNMKLFPCFRGEYPTRHRPGTYQWLQRTGPKNSQVMAVCECDDEQTITTEGNIITSCEVTEEHFLSIDCDDENKNGAASGPMHCNEFHSTNFNNGATSYMYAFPQSGTGPPDMDAYQPQVFPCPAMQQHPYQHQPLQAQSQCRPCCPNHQTEQTQTVCFSMQPEKQQRFSDGNAKSNPNGIGLTEMLAQQLQQQMQQAQAQIAQVQMQLNSVCGATGVRKLEVLSQSTQSVGKTLPEGEEQQQPEEDEEEVEEEEEDAEADSHDDNGNDLNNSKYTEMELPCACIAKQFRLQQHQKQQQQQHQFQQQAAYFCGATPPSIQATAPQPFMFSYQQPPSTSAPLQFGCYPMPFAPQEQQCPPFPTIGCPYQSQQQQQLTQQQSSQSNSQQNMCPHGNHFCPSCSYRQRFAQMRFMMPRCWPR